MKCSGVAVAVASVGVAYYSTVKYLVKLALDRNAPKNIEKKKNKMRGTKKANVLSDVLLEKKKTLESRECENIEIEAYDGIKLVGHWYECDDAERVIVAMHGWRSSWSKDFALMADFWLENHCSVLLIEQRGQGDSGGEYMGFGLLERYDCLEWVRLVNKKTKGRLPIYLCGISMGATTVMMAGSLDLPDNVCGIIADCGFTSPHEIWKHVVEDKFHMPYALYRGAVTELCKKKLKIDSASYSTLDALRCCTVPVLFVHGAADHFVPVEMTFENYTACAAPKRLLVVPNATHGASYLIDSNSYQTAMKQFWNDFDGATLSE